MYKKRALVLGGYLSLLALAACWPKVVDDSDLVSIDYKYALDSAVDVFKKTAEFLGEIDWKQVYQSEYDIDKIQSYPAVVVKEAMQIADPEVWTNVELNSMWHGVITSIEKSSDWYDEYVVNFNDPKTYSELSYLIKITDIEKK